MFIECYDTEDRHVFINKDNILEIEMYPNGNCKFLTAPGCWTIAKKGTIKEVRATIECMLYSN